MEVKGLKRPNNRAKVMDNCKPKSCKTEQNRQYKKLKWHGVLESPGYYGAFGRDHELLLVTSRKSSINFDNCI